MTDTWECIIIGGGAAGLSAALSLGRARRRTLVIDAGRQSNLAAAGIGGLLGHDRRPPRSLYEDGRAELREYPTVELREGEVCEAVAEADLVGGFVVTLADGGIERARRLLLATGMEYRHVDLPGIAERWGHTAFHCPFCHGWEVRGRPLAVLAAGPAGVHMARLLTAWSDDVTLLAREPLAPEERDALADAGVAVEERPVAELLGPGRELEAVRLADGTELPCGGVLVQTTLHQRTPLAAQLGIAFTEPTPLSAEAIEVDAMSQTNVPGVYAAGDVLNRPPSVAGAIAAGNLAGAMVVNDLTAGVGALSPS